ncbi:hypothetical protein EDC01DRAFT_462821 [Geopyxis carbonaria]|nr:hypothetical protein EDC01DRAFT_462821 [Geopyxis carbonaria]
MDNSACLLADEGCCAVVCCLLWRLLSLLSLSLLLLQLLLLLAWYDSKCDYLPTVLPSSTLMLERRNMISGSEGCVAANADSIHHRESRPDTASSANTTTCIRLGCALYPSIPLSIPIPITVHPHPHPIPNLHLRLCLYCTCLPVCICNPFPIPLASPRPALPVSRIASPTPLPGSPNVTRRGSTNPLPISPIPPNPSQSLPAPIQQRARVSVSVQRAVRNVLYSYSTMLQHTQ